MKEIVATLSPAGSRQFLITLATNIFLPPPPPPHPTTLLSLILQSESVMDRWQRVVLAKYWQICSASDDYIIFVYKQPQHGTFAIIKIN